jgi:hypothetical protein
MTEKEKGRNPMQESLKDAISLGVWVPLSVDPLPSDAVAVYVDSVLPAQIEELRIAMQQSACRQGLFVVCDAPTLPVVIKRLSAECAALAAELNTMEPDALLSVRGRALANREQELVTTLTVLRGLGQQPVQIQEPEAVAD